MGAFCDSESDVFRQAIRRLSVSLYVCPVTLAEANAFVAKHHRHHKPVPGCKFALAVAEDDEIVGVALVGRPVARHYDDGWTLEVNRTCTNGHKNANSMLYGAAWRTARAMGYRRLITYTRTDESGASLRGAGWRVVAIRPAQSWAGKKRPRIDASEPFQRTLWEAV